MANFCPQATFTFYPFNLLYSTSTTS
uniref:Uncharacterized protein n=1 Tax=Anguilla anguilla TaxID=7936 RepID=A0A0E9PLR7_ANGAN